MPQRATSQTDARLSTRDRAERDREEEAALQEARELELDRQWVRERRLAHDRYDVWVEVVGRALLTAFIMSGVGAFVTWAAGWWTLPPKR